MQKYQKIIARISALLFIPFTQSFPAGARREEVGDVICILVFGVTSVRAPVNLHVFEADRVPTIIQGGVGGGK